MAPTTTRKLQALLADDKKNALFALEFVSSSNVTGTVKSLLKQRMILKEMEHLFSSALKYLKH